MKMKRRILLVLVVIGIFSLFLSSCGSKGPKTLEEYIVENQGERDSLEAIVQGDPNAEVNIAGNTLELTYTVTDSQYTKDMLDQGLNSLGDTFKGIISDLETKTGLQGINVNVKYVDSEGNEITSKLFE